MQDDPTPSEILAGVEALMRETVMPELTGRTNYLVRVAANAVALVRRQMELKGEFDAEELKRLHAILKHGGDDLYALNEELEKKIANRELTLETPGLREHLWETTMAKLAVDQPSYAAYQRALKTEL